MKRLKHREYLTVALAAAALIAGALCPLPAAADPGTLEVTAPSSITLGSLYGTGDATNSSATPGSVKCEGYPGYTLTIKSDDDDGKMYSGANKLAAPLKVTAVLEKGTGADVTSGGTLTDVVVTREQQTVGGTNESSTGTNNIALSVSQARQTSGAAGEYSLILTFTATAKT